MIKVGSIGRHAFKPKYRPPYVTVCILWFCPKRMKFELWYRESGGDITTVIPEQCTKSWLNCFLGSSETLNDDSYYLRSMESGWAQILLSIQAEL